MNVGPTVSLEGGQEMIKAAEAMTVAEARERYAGKWLALEVVSRDRSRVPKKVRLIAKARTRHALCQKIKSVPSAYITFAGPLVPPEQEYLC
jgi:hypothetical protein